jgi:group II intron reverse transcriptase/maturase
MELLEGTMTDRPRSNNISPRLQRIAELARRMPGTALTSLSHHIDIEFLREAFARTRKDGAAGIDGRTAADYAEKLDENLSMLLDRFKSGLYRAPAVRRVYIPKADGKRRPIGIPTIEDKILQRAVAMVLEAVYEQDFLPFSWGFRPGKRMHDALQGLRDWLMSNRGGWVVEVDIKGFFDAIPHADLRSFLDQRVRDGVIRRAIGKWLNAGVMEGGVVHRSKSGSPQGGVISPLLANVFLHHVFDVWFVEQLVPQMWGRSYVVRFADDIVIAFEREDDAKRVMNALPKRFGRYGLTLHPDKTRLVRFKRPPRRGRDDNDEGGTFSFLGLTHHWARSRKGNWVIKQKTAKDRFKRGCRAISLWCRRNRHRPVKEQAKALGAKLRGHYNHFGVTGNSRALGRFFYVVRRIWYKWLKRRSQRRRMNWERFAALLRRHPIPPPRLGARGWHAANP